MIIVVHEPSAAAAARDCVTALRAEGAAVSVYAAVALPTAQECDASLVIGSDRFFRRLVDRHYSQVPVATGTAAAPPPLAPVAFHPLGEQLLSRTYGLRLGVRDTVARLLRRTPQKLDVGRVQTDAGEHAFLNTAAVGWLATSDRWRDRVHATVVPAGAGNVIADGVALAAGARPISRIKLDHTEARVDARAVLIANGQFVRGGALAAPRALPADGILNVQAWTHGRGGIVRALSRIAIGEHLGLDCTREWQSREVTLPGAGHPISLDGQVVGQTPATFSTHAEQVNLLT